MSYTQFRMTGAEESDKTPSEFVTTSQKHDSVSFGGPCPKYDPLIDVSGHLLHESPRNRPCCSQEHSVDAWSSSA